MKFQKIIEETFCQKFSLDKMPSRDSHERSVFKFLTQTLSIPPPRGFGVRVNDTGDRGVGWVNIPREDHRSMIFNKPCFNIHILLSHVLFTFFFPENTYI